MTKFFTVVFTLFVLLSGCNNQSIKPHSDWKLVFHHDAAGQTIKGDKQTLINAVSEGRPVRLVWPLRENFIHVADAGFLTVMNGEVFAQIDDIIRQIPDQKTRKSIALDAKEQSRWHAIFSTTGEVQAFQSRDKKLNTRQRTLKWYVDTPAN